MDGISICLQSVATSAYFLLRLCGLHIWSAIGRPSLKELDEKEPVFGFDVCMQRSSRITVTFVPEWVVAAPQLLLLGIVTVLGTTDALSWYAVRCAITVT